MEIINFLLPIGVTFIFSFVSSLFYFRMFHKREVAMAINLFAIAVFCIVYFVTFDNNIGLGIGLLGVLSLVRLRARLDSLFDILFIFMAITFGLIAASVEDVSMVVFVDSLLMFIACVFSSRLIFKKRYVTTKIVFDDINFDRMDDMSYLKDRVRTALKINPIYVRVSKVDYLKDSVTVRVTYVVH